MKRLIVFLLFFNILNACSQQKNTSDTDNTIDSTVSIDIDKPSPGRLYDKAYRAYTEGYYSEAVALCTTIIELDVNYTAAYFLRGKCHRELRNYGASIENYNEVLIRNPEDVSAYVNRGGGYLNIGNYPAAIEDYNQAIKRNPNSRLAYYNRAVVYEKLGEMDKACTDWKKAAELGDEDAAAEVEKNCK
ncbi:MAG: tetratricopeptide repeat protein [Thermonemataceae bacterium]